ncbi:hypothetical protein BH23BAC1_BH23BAC1_43690 [soil metagenome]
MLSVQIIEPSVYGCSRTFADRKIKIQVKLKHAHLLAKNEHFSEVTKILMKSGEKLIYLNTFAQSPLLMPLHTYPFQSDTSMGHGVVQCCAFHLTF